MRLRTWRVLANIVAATLVMGAVHDVSAFTFVRNEKGEILTRSIPPSYASARWGKGTTESWSRTGNTVWSHCELVLKSYATTPPSAGDILGCERQIAASNQLTRNALSRLRPGQVLWLPLPRDVALKLESPPPPAKREEAIEPSVIRALQKESAEQKVELTRLGTKLESGLAALGEAITGVRTEIRSSRKQNEEIAKAVADVRAERVASEGIARPNPLENNPLTLLLTSPQLALPVVLSGIGGGCIVALLLVPFLLYLRRRWKIAYITIPENKLQFDKETRYQFDGKDYPIWLIRLDKEGEWYRTQFSGTMPVRKENLNSHFNKHAG